jgi:zinc protease
MMQMEADRMRGLKLTEEDVATERQVILEERSQRTDSDPGALMGEQMRAAQFLNHPYGRPIIGWRAEMEQLSRQDALDFYKANYAPNNAIVVVAGDVTPDQVKALAEQNYGPLAPSEDVTRQARPQEPPQLAERRLNMTDDRVSQPSFSRSYLAPERDPGDQRTAAALTILAEYLGGNPTTALLARKMQFEDPVAVYTGAAYDGTAVDDTTFGFYAVPLPGKSLQDVETALDKVLAEFMAQGIDAEDFARIKTQIRAADIYARDSSRGMAQTYGESLAVGLTLQDIEDWPDILQSITPEEVMAAAQSVLDRKTSVTVWLSQTEEAAQ